MQPLPLHRFLLRFALAGVNVFAWIFLFQYFYILQGNLSRALAQSALLYALANVIMLLVTPAAAQTLRKGARRALLFAVLIAAGAFIFLGAAFEGFWSPAFTAGAIVLFALLIGTYRALYWVPYEVEAVGGDGRNSSILAEVFVALAPAAAGIFIAWNAFSPVLILYIGAGVILLSIVPLFSLREIHEGFSWRYRRTFHELLSPEHGGIFLYGFLEGVSGAALLLFWPLGIFLLTGWSYGLLGIILTITFLAAIFLRVPVRALMRKAQLRNSTLLTTVLSVTPWLFRLVIASPLGVIFVDSYFYTTTPRRQGLDPLVFEQSSDGGSFLDEYTALKEMSLSLGRTVVCIVGAAVALLTSVPVTFVVVFLAAAGASAAVALRAR